MTEEPTSGPHFLLRKLSCPTPACGINSPFTRQPKGTFKDRIGPSSYLTFNSSCFPQQPRPWPPGLSTRSLPASPPTLTPRGPATLASFCPLKPVAVPTPVPLHLLLQEPGTLLPQAVTGLRIPQVFAPTSLPQRGLLQPPPGPPATVTLPVSFAS